MRLSDAVQMIRPAVARRGGSWADFGAGTGLFTLALAEILGPSATILAIDRDPRALAALSRQLPPRPGEGPVVLPIEGDFRRLEAIDALRSVRLDGALFANALHFVPDAGGVLSRLRPRLCERGRVAIVEYADRPPSRWVPYPLSVAEIQRLARQAGLRFIEVVAERPSRYGGTMYCASLENQAS